MALSSTLYRVMDDRITEILKPYLAIGYGRDGKPYSDVIVKDGNVEIINLYAWPNMLTEELASMGLPFAVRLMHCNTVKVKVPWFSWTTNPIEVAVDGMMLVIEPTKESEWTLEQIRASKERVIENAFAELQKRHASTKRKSLFDRMKAQFWANFRPKISITNLHIRYEQFDTVSPSVGHSLSFSLGLMLDSCDVSTTIGNDLHTQKEINFEMKRVEVYCRTTEMGATSVIKPQEDRVRALKRFKAEQEQKNVQFSTTKLEAMSQRATQGAGALAGTVQAFRDTLRSEDSTWAGTSKVKPWLNKAVESIDLSKLTHRERDPKRLQEFYDEQDVIVVAMHTCAAESTTWFEHEWLVKPMDEVAFKGKLHSIEPKKAESFSFNVPLQVAVLHISSFDIQATDMQLAALVTVPTRQWHYRMWSKYASLRQELPEYHSAMSVREKKALSKKRWRIAGRAILQAMQGGNERPATILDLLESRQYRDKLTNMLKMYIKEDEDADDAGDIHAARQAQKKSHPADALALQTLEDRLPVPLIAWCRFMASVHAKTYFEGHERGSLGTAASAFSHLLKGKRRSHRGNLGFDDSQAAELSKSMVDALRPSVLLSAPVGYVRRVIDVRMQHCVVRLHKAQTIAERIEALTDEKSFSSNTARRNWSMRHRSESLSLAETLKSEGSMLSLTLDQLQARARFVVTHVTQAQDDERASEAPVLGNDGVDISFVLKEATLRNDALNGSTNGESVMLRMKGETDCAVTDEMLGGPSFWAGDVSRRPSGVVDPSTSSERANSICRELLCFAEKEPNSPTAYSSNASKLRRRLSVESVPLAPAESSRSDSKSRKTSKSRGVLRGLFAGRANDRSAAAAAPAHVSERESAKAKWYRRSVVPRSDVSEQETLLSGLETNLSSECESEVEEEESLFKMAVQAHVFIDGDETEGQDEWTVLLSKAEACYDTQFWADVHDFFTRVYAPMAPSPILGTQQVRRKFSSLQRGISTTLKGSHLTCERLMMSALQSLADVFITPNERSACLIQSGGAAMRLRTRPGGEYSGSEPRDILDAELPPFKLHRWRPDGMSEQRAEITFQSPIHLSTPLVSHVEKTIYATGLWPCTDAEVALRKAEFELVKKRIELMEKEKRKLDLLFTELRAHAQLQALTQLAGLVITHADAEVQVNLTEEPELRSHAMERASRFHEITAHSLPWDMEKFKAAWAEAKMPGMLSDLFNRKEGKDQERKPKEKEVCCGCFPAWLRGMRLRRYRRPSADDRLST